MKLEKEPFFVKEVSYYTDASDDAVVTLADLVEASIGKRHDQVAIRYKGCGSHAFELVERVSPRKARKWRNSPSER